MDTHFFHDCNSGNKIGPMTIRNDNISGACVFVSLFSDFFLFEFNFQPCLEKRVHIL